MNTHYTLKTSLTYFFSLALATLFCVSFLTPLTAEAGGLFITKNLSAGARDPEVQALQQALNNLNITVATSGAGSVGNETTFFGQLTKNALTRFQARNNLPADGVFDSATRSKLNIFTALNLLQKNGISLPARTQNIENENIPTNGEVEGEADTDPTPTNGESEGEDEPTPTNGEAEGEAIPEFGTSEDAEAYADSVEAGDVIPGEELSGEALAELETAGQTLLDGILAGLPNIGDLIQSLGLTTTLSNAGGLPFGGRVLFAKKCTCGPGWWVVIGPPKGGLFHYIGPQQFQNFTFPTPGVWSLGLYWPGGMCMMKSSGSCFRMPTKGLIPGFVGSS